MKTILSIYGGGMRGLIPARFCDIAVEQRLGKSCAEVFGMGAGTSTGGILALGLMCPGANGKPKYTAAQLVDLYRKEGGRIFSRSPGHIIATADGASGPKYPSAGVEGVLHDYFGDVRLSEALRPTLVTSFDTQAPDDAFFKSYAPDASRYFMRDVARATSAAPTYFDPLQAAERILIDGGVSANNPAMCAWADADEALGTRDNLLLVSLGTGETLPKCNPVGWGVVQWLKYLAALLMTGASDAAEYQAKRAFPPVAGQRRYFRFQCSLDGVPQEMDDASPSTVAALLKRADDMIVANAAAIDELLVQLRGVA